ncbi:hypothetical protein PHYPO_G00104940 [Pangasianodon hypophthalmus]|uniref:Uncharacterized protein n=1 Tax=Pangasianodon hypophthalmus TaxID=310915 RepID=A0A5N5PX54_PANHP|nr:hypothetical protein PHYPO_G00104940 [Pangasianodon hypophthalmus]
MEPRGQNWNEQWPQNQRSDHRVRDEQYRSHHTGKQGHYPPPDGRDSERRWYAPDPRYMYYMSGPPPAEFSTAYSSQTYTPDRARSQSRQGYDYPPRTTGTTGMTMAITIMATTEAIMDTQQPQMPVDGRCRDGGQRGIRSGQEPHTHISMGTSSEETVDSLMVVFL